MSCMTFVFSFEDGDSDEWADAVDNCPAILPRVTRIRLDTPPIRSPGRLGGTQTSLHDE